MKPKASYRKSGSRRPRRNLASVGEQWKSGDTHGAVKNQDRAFRAFAAEFVGHKPTGLRGYHDVTDLFEVYRDEILAATEPPFNDEPDPEHERAMWRSFMIEAGFTIAVPYEGDILHVREMSLYKMRVAEAIFRVAWFSYWSSHPSGVAPHEHWVSGGDTDREAKFQTRLRFLAETEAAYLRDKIARGEPLDVADLLKNPRLSWHSQGSQKATFATAKNSASPTPSSLGLDQAATARTPIKAEASPVAPTESYAPGIVDNRGAPPAKPDPNEPFMRDGSHLLASERGRRKIDPVTGKRMIRRMVLTPDAWPHYEWVEDVESEFGVGPHGPDCGIWMPDDPNVLSPREAARPYLEKMGRMDLLHKFMPGPNDADQSNPPEPYFCYPKDWPGQPK